MVNYNKMVNNFWKQIVQAELPFPSARAITTLPSGDGAIRNSGIPEYQDSKFDGIYLRSNGQSGADERWQLECTSEMSLTRFKAYVNHGNIWCVYELQVWGAGTWAMNNPAGQPRIPNAVVIGDVIGIFEEFTPTEYDPKFPPPPTHNPFEPYLKLEGRQDNHGNYIDEARVTLLIPVGITLEAVYVYKNGAPVGVSLEDLLAGHIFTEAGEYEIVIHYRFQNNERETVSRAFTIINEPATTSIVFSARKCAVDAELPCGKFEFGIFDEDGKLILMATNN